MADDERLRVREFEQQLLLSLGRIVAELYNDLRGEVSNDARRGIYDQLNKLSDLAIDVPAGISALGMLDKLTAMFPPPET